MNTEDRKVEVKMIRHEFTPAEMLSMGNDLANTHDVMASIEAEQDQAKAAFKGRITEIESKQQNISVNIRNKWEFRQERCWVTYIPKTRKKEYRLEDATDLDAPVLVEDMTNDDFQADLIRAEAKFNFREEIELFRPVDGSYGNLVVGKWKDRWYAALRMKLAGRTIDERLDPEARAVKHRIDCVSQGCKRAFTWISENLGADAAKGFEEAINNIPKFHKEREE